eukprot:3315074-Amphidinium_carterae.1
MTSSKHALEESALWLDSFTESLLVLLKAPAPAGHKGRQRLYTSEALLRCLVAPPIEKQLPKDEYRINNTV